MPCAVVMLSDEEARVFVARWTVGCRQMLRSASPCRDCINATVELAESVSEAVAMTLSQSAA